MKTFQRSFDARRNGDGVGDKVELEQVEYEKQTQIVTFCINSRFLNTIKKKVNKIGIFLLKRYTNENVRV